MGRCRECNRVLNYPEDDAIVDKQGILCIECGEGKVVKCGCGNEAEYQADNNQAGEVYWYCSKCEEHRSDKYGCAMIISEGVMCQDGACGCDGTGVY
jgi:hypothetical protein